VTFRDGLVDAGVERDEITSTIEELETTIDLGPSNRQVALEAAVALSSAAVRTHGGPPSTQDWQRVLDRALAAADRFHAWLSQDEEPVDDIERRPQVGLGATDHGCDE
jgi:hypothetical protein